MNENENKHLPTATSDGYDTADDEHVVGAYLKWTAETEWLIDGAPIDPAAKLVAIGVAHTLTHWQNQTVVEEITDHPLPDLDALNSAIPKSQWEIGLNGEPREPWSHTFKVFFLDRGTGERSVYATSTTGGRIAWDRLTDKVRWIRRLRGENVVPRIELGTAPMKT